ncbi:MAG: cation transporter [Candidatus Thiodiazotropha taylori]|nr:cation transporter [Candidatus Thiodiazotropha taylori]MCG8088279.1 cation transporter [Candidatus Thiodiazotropha taylori]MCW4273649.1 cation transporter [Candidatus Thiodiazotropha taylori]
MQNCCSSTQCTDGTAAVSPEFRKALWIALIVNLIMFNIEVVGGLYANSVSLLADAVDFAGDAANYALSLSVLSLGLLWRARAALIKGMTMGAYGLLVVGKTVWATLYGTAPEAYTMGLIGLVALVANLSVAVMLYRFRDGDANMRSVWLCSRNDSIVNLMIILAALGVLGTETRWPDLIVAAVVSALAISSAISIVVQARYEIATAEKTAMSLPVTVKIDESK